LEQPDNAEKAMRFGCGFVFALAVLGFGAFRLLVSEGLLGLAVILPALILFGILAMKKGDSFWRWFSDWSFWWR
jgi:small-conductance mechanosensitive channel